MVDRQHRSGGHRNNAYPFVRLHQPSEYYGVASRELSHGIKDTIGFNAGLYGLASGAQVLACFDQVMQQRFLTSGRVRLVCDVGICHRPGRQTPGPLTHQRQQPADHGAQKVVDATHAHTAVLSTRPPKYAVAPGVRCVPLNQLQTAPTRRTPSWARARPAWTPSCGCWKTACRLRASAGSCRVMPG